MKDTLVDSEIVCLWLIDHSFDRAIKKDTVLSIAIGAAMEGGGRRPSPNAILATFPNRPDPLSFFKRGV